jgi:hypothetical protein
MQNIEAVMQDQSLKIQYTCTAFQHLLYSIVILCQYPKLKNINSSDFLKGTVPLVYICLEVTWLKRPKCARRDFVVHQRMNANGLLPYNLFSWNKAKQDGEILKYGGTEHYYYLHTKWQLFTVITYTVLDESSLSRRTLLLVFLVGPWECCPLLCCWSTAYLAPRLEGLAFPHSSLPNWPHFPQGPGTFPLLHRIH